MERNKVQTLRRVVFHLTYVGTVLFFISRVVDSFIRWKREELGTIQKFDNPPHVEFPSFTICTEPFHKPLAKPNEVWAIPEPNLNTLTLIRQTFIENDRYIFENYSLILFTVFIWFEKFDRASDVSQ